MSSLKKSFLFVAVKATAFFFMLLPISLSLKMGRFLGRLAYYLLGKKRKVVYANLKTVFASMHEPAEIKMLTKSVFVNFIQSLVELLCLPKIKRLGLEHFVELKGKEYIDEARARGKGVILLAIHSGSWELASIVGAVSNGAYHIVANDQSKMPQLDKMLNEYRVIAGAHVIFAGSAAKEIIKAMKANEVVSLTLDQGGKTGLVIPLLGKTASMSTGAIRLALKYGCAICPVWIQRQPSGKHVLAVSKALTLDITGDLEKDVQANVTKASAHFEQLLKQYPQEYLWFYKVFKYSNQEKILVLDDGRTGHLRQSQAVVRSLKDVLKKKSKFTQENAALLQWRYAWSAKMFSLYAFCAQYVSFLKDEGCLRYFLTEDSFKHLMKYKADIVISCGSQAAGVNFILSQNHMAKSIAILKPGLISQKQFDAVVLPEHDKPHRVPLSHLITPRLSPNLINEVYLKEQSEGLMNHYSHLKGNVRTKFGVLLGGDTKGVKFEEAQIRQLLSQLKDAALHYNADILLTTSRRTSSVIEQVVLKELKGFERCSLCIIANQRNIPEAVGGILGLSDLIIVSGESISMVSESLCSGKPTIVFSPHGAYQEKPRDKYEGFVLKLNDQGYLMVTSVNDLKTKIAQLLSRKIMLKSLDDESIIKSGLEAIL